MISKWQILPKGEEIASLIKGRHSSSIMRRLFRLMNTFQRNHLNTIITSLDAGKAFDQTDLFLTPKRRIKTLIIIHLLHLLPIITPPNVLHFYEAQDKDIPLSVTFCNLLLQHPFVKTIILQAYKQNTSQNQLICRRHTFISNKTNNIPYKSFKSYL